MRNCNKCKAVLLVVSFLLPALCAGCGGGADAPPEDGHLIYYLAPEEDCQGADRIAASAEDLDLAAGASAEAQARAVVERLLEGPADGSMTSPLPAGVELLSLEIRDKRAYVDLSGAFGQMSGVALSMADYCLALSLTALDGVNAVTVTCQGREVGQQPRTVFRDRDVLLSTRDDVLQTAEVTLYFLDGNDALTGETRTIEIYEGQTLAENLIAELLAGPESGELHRALPEDFAVSSVRVENGVCTLNLFSASLALLPQDQNAQRQCLWSLADSLYSIDTVQEIRILSDGEELTTFGDIPVSDVSARPMG